jgi:peptidyl-prolyl cis-trans isomerase D
MFTVIRKNQQVLMLVIAVMTIVAFIWLYNRTNLDKVGTNDVASVYGRVVQKAEIDRLARGYGLALRLGLTDLVRDLGGMGADEETSVSDYILNTLVIAHQAPELGIRPSDAQVVSVIQGLSAFQSNGVFDPAKYASFLQDQLAPNGLTERHLEEIVRDSIRVREIRKVVTSPVAVGEGQVRDAARIYQAASGQVIRFDRADYAKQAAVTDTEVQTFFSRNKDGLRAPETRGFLSVSLELPEDQAKLTGKEKAAALQKLADKAVETGKALRQQTASGADFAKAAASSSLRVKKTDPVDRSGQRDGKDAGVSTALVDAAFALKGPSEVSDIIQDGDAFIILTLDKVTPARQLELAEVSEKITALLKGEKESKLAVEAATKAMEKIRAAMKEGKGFDAATQAAGVKTETFSSVVPSDSKGTPEKQAFAAATLTLREGALGDLQPAPWGAFAVFLTSRTPLTADQWKEHAPALEKTILSNEKDLLFLEWLRASRAAAQVQVLAGNGRRGGA